MDVKHVDYKKVVYSSGVMVFVLFALASSASAGGGFYDEVIAKVSPIICDIYAGFISIATGVAALIMVIAGIKWISSENDPGARKAAKDAMIHAIVGLIIINIIVSIINMFTGSGGMKWIC